MRKITKKRAHQVKFTKCLSKPNNCARMCSTKWTLPLKKQNIPSIIAFERKTSRKWNCLTPFLHPNFHNREKPFPKESWCIWIMFSCYYVARNLVPSQGNRGKTSQRLWQPEFCSWPAYMIGSSPATRWPSLRITRTCQKTHSCCTQDFPLKQDSYTARSKLMKAYK